MIHVGFLDEETKRSALAGCLALLQPSYFESFSIVLCEAWLQGRPALVQGRSEVLEGQARRSGGAIPYRGFVEFEAALDLLLADPGLADRMGAGGSSMWSGPTTGQRCSTRWKRQSAWRNDVSQNDPVPRAWSNDGPPCGFAVRHRRGN